MFELLIELPWIIQISVIFGAIIAALLAVVAAHDVIVRARAARWNLGRRSDD